jgi:hypothetical protein
MSKVNLTGIANNAKTVLSKHAPEILIGVGIAGMWSTSVMAVAATPKAVSLVEEERIAKEVDALTPWETVKTCWKCYIPAVATGLASTVCLVGGTNISVRRSAALATAYKLSENALSEYKNAVVETIGEKKERTVRDKVAENALKKNPVDEENIIDTGRGGTLCHDRVFGSYFRSSRDIIERAVVEVNRKIVSGEMYASLNDFYDEIGLEHIDIGDLLGWNLDDGEIKIEVDYGPSHNGEPTLVISYNVVPKYDFYRFV